MPRFGLTLDVVEVAPGEFVASNPNFPGVTFKAATYVDVVIAAGEGFRQLLGEMTGEDPPDLAAIIMPPGPN